MIITNLVGKKIKLRLDKKEETPKNTRQDVEYEIVGIKTGKRTVTPEHSKPFEVEEIMQVLIINDAGYLSYVYTSQIDFKPELTDIKDLKSRK